MVIISDSISNDSIKKQIPQLEEYLSELLRLMIVSYNEKQGDTI
jgi:hypothetical protein